MTSPEAVTIIITRWPWPEPDGAAADSDTAMWLWLPILGPVTTLLWRRLARDVARSDGGARSVVGLARTLGITPTVAHAALGRLARYGLVHPSGSGWAVRSTALVPPPRRVAASAWAAVEGSDRTEA